VPERSAQLGSESRSRLNYDSTASSGSSRTVRGDGRPSEEVSISGGRRQLIALVLPMELAAPQAL
jgi:hypothetical protein